MQKLDRLVWVGSLSFTSHGVRVGVRVNMPSALAALPDFLPPYRRPLPSPYVDRLYSLVLGRVGPRPGIRRLNVLYANSARIARTADVDEMWQTLESDLQLYVAEHARRQVFVHAGVVGWRGRVIVIPGSSFSGKSTLVAAFIKAGATYYSDEYAILDTRGLVHPYAKPLSIRDGRPMSRARVRAETLGGSTGVQPVPVGVVVITEYQSGARWRARRLSTAQGAMALLTHTVAARRHPRRALTTLSRALRDAEIWTGRRGEADPTVELLLNKVANLKR
jgi:hypothetical protein